MELFEILQLRQSELKAALKKELAGLHYKPVERKGFLYAAGEVPVLLVAHLDTVHQELPTVLCQSQDGRYLMSPQGIGGDDRAGVYMILQILRRARCHVLFCEDEETGGRGARAFTRSSIVPAVRYMVELDRQGENDAVFYGCWNPAFQKFILGFGFAEARGSFSDISILAPHFDIAAVNLSAGYYNAHQRHEVIDRRAVEENIERLAQMVLQDAPAFPYRGKSSLLPWTQTAFPMETETETDSDRKLLMRLPEGAKLLLNGVVFVPGGSYLVDSQGNVYVYLESLDAAVASESVYACDSGGGEIVFCYQHAGRYRVVSYEEALDLMETSKTS